MNNPTIISNIHNEIRAGITSSPEPDLKYLKDITDSFSDYFGKIGYNQEPAVRICEPLDPTVRFIGAPISVLKPYFLSNAIPLPGIFMVQNCIRTRNLKLLISTNSTPKYGSFFTGMCVLVPYERLGKLCAETIDYIKTYLGLNDSEIIINISERDSDLIEASKNLLPSHCYIIDTKPELYYRHKYGIDGVRGRNFNIALKNVSTGDFEDIGNIIVIEQGSNKLGVELAIGDTTILQLLFGYKHILDCYGLKIECENDSESSIRLLQDTIITTLAIAREGIRPTGGSTQSRTLKQYLRALSFHKEVLGIDDENFEKLVENTEKSKLPFVYKDAWEKIIMWVDEQKEADRSSVL